MRWLIAATVAVFGVLAVPGVSAQINGVPASVTSQGFGGHHGPQGVPPSITSIGPRGIVPNHQFFNEPTCCINPLFPVNPNPPLFPRRHHHQRNSFRGVAVYPVPYEVAVPVAVDEQSVDDSDQYNGGPTIFDRRGSGGTSYATEHYVAPREERETAPAPAAEPEPVADQPQTILVFKDGHELEVSNYAIVGDTLFDLTQGHHRRIPLAELDLAATSRQNDDRGLDFQLPIGTAAN